MAIGDCFGVFMGTANVTRQPASGEFEQVSSLAKQGTTDAWRLFDGTNNVQLLTSGVRTDNTQADASSTRANPFNMATLIGNTVYLEKQGTTDRFAVSGVQVDA